MWLWDDIRRLSFLVCIPWIQLGDFNVVRKSSERNGDLDLVATEDLNRCLLDINTEDLLSKGYWFPHRKGGTSASRRRLDRTFVKAKWAN